MTNRKQYSCVNGATSSTLINTYYIWSTARVSIIGPLLFLIYINHLNKAVKHSTTNQFADDTSLLYRHSSLKNINKHVNHDLSSIVHWLRANRISLNVDKTEIIIFRPKKKTIKRKRNFRISGQKIKTTTKTKYLGINLEEHLTWSQHIKLLKSKLSRANGLLSKIRYYTSQELLRTIYYALFDSHVRYGCQIWGHSNSQLINDLAILQRKAMRILTFKDRFTPAGPLFKQLQILNLEQIIQSQNCLLPLNHINKSLPDTFQENHNNTSNTIIILENQHLTK